VTRKVRNAFEARVQESLGSRYRYEPLKLSYTVEHAYTPDFVDFAKKHIVESKGYFSPEDRKKMKAVIAQNPEWTVHIVFQNPLRTISKKSATTYAGWCDKNGISWSRL